jgi:hypothetical protein
MTNFQNVDCIPPINIFLHVRVDANGPNGGARCILFDVADCFLKDDRRPTDVSIQHKSQGNDRAPCFSNALAQSVNIVGHGVFPDASGHHGVKSPDASDPVQCGHENVGVFVLFRPVQIPRGWIHHDVDGTDDASETAADLGKREQKGGKLFVVWPREKPGVHLVERIVVDGAVFDNHEQNFLWEDLH